MLASSQGSRQPQRLTRVSAHHTECDTSSNPPAQRTSLRVKSSSKAPVNLAAWDEPSQRCVAGCRQRELESWCAQRLERAPQLPHPSLRRSQVARVYFVAHPFLSVRASPYACSQPACRRRGLERTDHPDDWRPPAIAAVDERRGLGHLQARRTQATQLYCAAASGYALPQGAAVRSRSTVTGVTHVWQGPNRRNVRSA